MSPVREHMHRCPTCKLEWWCSEYSCHRTNYNCTKFCRGSRCMHDDHDDHDDDDDDEPSNQLELFDEQ